MFLGIEIGGTKLQLGVGPGDGTIVALERARVDPAAGAERIRQQILELVPTLLSKAGMSKSDIRAVGIGFGGPVDAENGIVTKSHQVEGWVGFPLADWSRRDLGWPTVVHNDADTAGLAEACFGAGRGLSPIFYITIGSGIGGGLIIDQKIYRGAGVGAAEIGQLRLPPDPRRRGGESRITVEAMCSGWAIGNRTREFIASVTRPGTRFWDDAARLFEMVDGKLELLTAETIARAAREGNELAHTILGAGWNVLGYAIAQVTTLLCPRRIVIGGGVALMGEELLFGPLRAEVARFAFPPFADIYDIVPAELGEAVVVQGALQLARDSIADDR